MYFNFSIRNFFKKKKKFDSFFFYHKPITKNKHFEVQCCTDDWYIFSMEFKIGYKEDHAGIKVSFSLLGREIYFQFYDIRHWNYKNDCWDEDVTDEMIKNNFDGF